MKKVFVFTLICLALLLLVPGVVSAEETPVATGNSVQSGQTVVTYGVQAKYLLVVPPNFNISTGSAIHTGVRVSNGLLAEGTAVAVNVSSSFYNTSAGSEQAAWRMVLNNNIANIDTGKFISYHLHNATRQETGTGANGNPIYSYTEHEKIESGVTFMYAPATAFSHGDGEVVKYLSFRVDAASLAGISLAGTYTDTLEFSAAIVTYPPTQV